MKKVLILLLAGSFLFACKKKDPANEDPASTTPIAKSGEITYKLNGTVVTKNGAGYVLGDDWSLVKWENGGEQLSMDFYGMATGTYNVSNAAKLAGNAKIYFYPQNSATTKTVWISKTGTFKVSDYQKTGGFKASGTFSATLEKYVNNVVTTEKMEINDGSFKDIMLVDAR